MTRRDPRRRSGITLTEILISIMILGIGMVSLATLFPIGLMRIRAAQQASRSVATAKLAINEIQIRDLFDKANFNAFYASRTADVWTIDGGPNPGLGVNRSFGTGLPVAYDPLWWSVTGQPTSLTNFRFGASQYTMTADAAGSLAAASAGLQRITFANGSIGAYEGIFVAPDDPVTQSDGGANAPPTINTALVPAAPSQTTGASPLVPDLSGDQVVFDYAYSWLFTGRQTDANDFASFDGSIVVFNNRPFGTDANGPAGERVVEAVFAPGRNNLDTSPFSATTYGYSRGDARVVWLRWPNSQPDPDVALGSWLADVTYEAVAANDAARNTTAPGQLYQGQRCHWYQVARRSAPDVDPDTTNFPNYRRMTVTLATPVRSKTLLMNDGSAQPAFTNTALLCPAVVHVFSRTFYNRK